MKTLLTRLTLLPAIGLLAIAFLLAPQTAFASTAHSQVTQQPNSVTTIPVYPRLSLPGCDYEDGFNGNVQWGTLPNPLTIKTWGEVWDECGTEAHVYLSWYDPGYQNKDAGHSTPFSTDGVNYSKGTFANAGHISVTVCAEWIGQWRCGEAYSV